MFDHVDPRSPTPLYEQIAARLRAAVATGELAARAPLPSVRQLATRLRVNPATVVQAYRLLEDEGLVEPRQGSGTFVREVGGDRRAAERARQARRLVEALVTDAARLGLSREELLAAIADILETERVP